MKYSMVKLMATLVGVFAVAAGVAVLIAPSYVLAAGRTLITPGGLYVVAAIRIGVGILFLAAARTSRLPKTVRAFGVLIVVAGISTPFFGTDRALAGLNWWAEQGAVVHRVPALFLIGLGAFTIFMIGSAGRRAA